MCIRDRLSLCRFHSRRRWWRRGNPLNPEFTPCQKYRKDGKQQRYFFLHGSTSWSAASLLPATPIKPPILKHWFYFTADRFEKQFQKTALPRWKHLYSRTPIWIFFRNLQKTIYKNLCSIYNDPTRWKQWICLTSLQFWPTRPNTTSPVRAAESTAAHRRAGLEMRLHAAYATACLLYTSEIAKQFRPACKCAYFMLRGFYPLTIPIY